MGLSTAAAGAIAGTATVGLTSDGSGGDGLGTTALTSQTVKITGAVYNAAVGKLASSSLAFGNHHVGDTVSGALSLTNGAAAGSYSEALDATLSSSATSLGASGTETGLLAGASNASALVVGLKTATAGAVSATATLALNTDGTNIDGLGTAALAAQSVAVTGAVYNEASATLASATINLGVVHVGQSATQTLSLTNAAPTGAYTEALDASFGGSGTGLLTGGTVAGLKAGGTDATDLTVGIGTSTSGVVSGKTSLTLLSDGAGIDGLGTTALAAQSIAVSGTVDSYAVAAFQDPQGPQITGSGTNYTLNLGTVAQGGTALSATLGVLNTATGLADLLGGSIATNGATGFTNMGFGAFSGLGAGQGETAQSLSLATNAAGTFSETIALSAAGSNASGYAGALPAETLTVTGTVTPVQPNVYTLANGPNTITGAAGGDLFIAGAGAINSRDTLTGGSGANVLQLTGAGSFDLSAPKAITGIQTIDAYEGQAAAGATPSTQQIVYLRSTAAETVNVLGSTPAAGNTSPEGITIYGGTMADTIDLGQGTDTVVLGGSTETINAGGGTGLVQAVAGYAKTAVIGNTTSSTTLQFTNAGTIVLNASDTDLTVALSGSSNLTLGAGALIAAVGSSAGDTITAGGAQQTLTGGLGTDQLIGSQAYGDTFLDTSAGLNGDSITNFGGSDAIDISNLAFASLTESYAGSTTKGTLSLGDGTNKLAITMVGNYTPASFSFASDGHAGTSVLFK